MPNTALLSSDTIAALHGQLLVRLLSAVLIDCVGTPEFAPFLSYHRGGRLGDGRILSDGWLPDPEQRHHERECSEAGAADEARAHSVD